MTLGKFVIPNPFGPYEEQRFTHYLMKNWFAKTTAVVNTPSYIRDNIHVSLLARIYAHFAATLPDGVSRANPTGYVESQGAFTQRVANEMRLVSNCLVSSNLERKPISPNRTSASTLIASIESR